MIKIGICDDEECLRKETLRICREYGKQNNAPMEYVEFTMGEELLAYNSQIDILLLDIELPGINGIEVIKQLEKDDKIGYVIFITGYQQYVYDTFGRKTLGFLVKPIDYSRFERCLNKALGEINGNVPIEIPLEDRTIIIYSGSLEYIEAQGCYSKLITNDNTYLVRTTLKEWEDRLKNNDFIRVHKSYLINMAFIKEIWKTVTIKNGIEITISRRKLPYLKEAYNNYIRRKAW